MLIVQLSEREYRAVLEADARRWAGDGGLPAQQEVRAWRARVQAWWQVGLVQL